MYSIHNCRYTQMYRYTIVDIHKCIDTQLYTHNCRYTQMYRYTIVDIHKCIATQL